MFARLKYIMNLDISNFDTSKVTYMNYMFDTMESLEKIYVSKYFQTTLVNQAVDMFRDDKKLV
jgi:surface protein